MGPSFGGGAQGQAEKEQAQRCLATNLGKGARDQGQKGQKKCPLKAILLDGATALFPGASHQGPDMGFKDGFQVEHTGAGRHVGALGFQGEIAQQVAVQSADDGGSPGVNDPVAGAGLGIGHKDLAPVFVSEADDDDPDSSLGGLSGGVQGKGVVILAVGEEQDHSGEVTAVPETRSGFADGFLQARASSGYAADVEVVQHQPEEAEVGGQGTENAGPARKGDQADLVAGQVREQVAKFGLGALQAIGRDVLGEHRSRDVQGDHDFRAHLGCLDKFEAPLGTHQGDHDGEHREDKQSYAQRPSPIPRLIDAPGLHGGCDETVEEVGAPKFQPDQQRPQDSDDPESVNELRFGEGQPRHGSLRRTLWAISVEAMMRASPNPAKTA